MKTLILDTSTVKTIFILADEKRLLAFQEYAHQNQLSNNFYPFLQEFLKKNEVTLQQIELFAVGIGPGSYTGTRVAVTSAKCFAFALNRPLISFCSLEAFLPSASGHFLSVAESKYTNHFALKGNSLESEWILSPLNFLSIEDLADKLQPGYSLVGDFSEHFLEKLSLHFSLSQLVVYPLQFNPSALVYRIAKKIQESPSALNQPISPLYFQ